MKLKITLLALLASTLLASAQVTPVLYHNNLDNNNTYESVEDIAVYNNEMYISIPEEGKIVKVSLAAPNSPEVDVLTGLSYPSGLAFVGSELYFVETANAALDANTGKLSKIDVAGAPTITVLHSTLQFPIDLAMNGTTAYIAETYVTGPPSNFDVDHMELSVVIAGNKTVLNSNFDYIDDIEYYNNTLYIVQFNEVLDASGIVTLDVTNNTPGTTQAFWTDTNNYYPYNAVISGTKMYLNADTSGSAILQLDLLNPSAPLVAVSGNFMFNGNSAYTNEMVVGPGNLLYALGESFDGSDEDYILYQIDLNLLGTDSFTATNQKMMVYPNPSTSVVSIANYTEGSPFTIYSIEGKMITAGIYNGAIDINGLNAGMYFIQLENGTSLKILKQ